MSQYLHGLCTRGYEHVPGGAISKCTNSGYYCSYANYTSVPVYRTIDCTATGIEGEIRGYGAPRRYWGTRVRRAHENSAAGHAIGYVPAHQLGSWAGGGRARCCAAAPAALPHVPSRGKAPCVPAGAAGPDSPLPSLPPAAFVCARLSRWTWAGQAARRSSSTTKRATL